ncbi:unnamed protein product [Arctia plantaginis]|uniref:CRAL-TRIO domain-containing protein n=1 Tax=Arctia plantaginis TaxID=874455 RepID=A0A8S1BD28_ARCPL|nr:unnamed protein product [Arctia plantaginis]
MSIMTSGSNSKFIREVKVNGIPVKTFIDLGSEVSLMQQTLASSLGLACSYPPRLLKGFGNNVISSIGGVRVDLCVDDAMKSALKAYALEIRKFDVFSTFPVRPIRILFANFWVFLCVKMAQVCDKDVKAIRVWLAKEPHLPKNFEDVTIKKFLFSCNCSLERTKKCIDEFCTRRAQMIEVFSNRDPLAKDIQHAFMTTNVTCYMDGTDEILIHELRVAPSEYDFYAFLKAFSLQADDWIEREREVLPENHVVILDIKLYTLKLVAKSNIFYFQKFILFLLDAMPVRLKQVHIINCPSFYEYLHNLVKPALPDYICNMIHFHSDHTGLYTFINRENLPKDYGGDCQDMAEQNAFWVKQICENRKVYLDDNFWKADLGQKVKYVEIKHDFAIKMSQVSDRDVETIKNWLAKETHLPKNFDDVAIKKFLYSCHNSLERTKKCIEEQCMRRANMPEIFTNRDPLSQRLQNALSITSVTTYKDGKDEILFHLLKEVPSNFDFYDCLKTFTLQVDIWIKLPFDVLPENHIAVYDIKQYTLKLVAKANIFYFQKFILYLLETMPVRLKQIHVINCPSFYEYLYNLVKPTLPENVCNLIHFHTDYTGLHKFINKKNLPKEYGGDSESMAHQNESWINHINGNRKMFLDDSFWKADLSQKVSNSGVDTSMNGSFKTLQFD